MTTKILENYREADPAAAALKVGHILYQLNAGVKMPEIRVKFNLTAGSHRRIIQFTRRLKRYHILLRYRGHSVFTDWCEEWFPPRIAVVTAAATPSEKPIVLISIREATRRKLDAAKTYVAKIEKFDAANAILRAKIAAVEDQLRGAEATLAYSKVPLCCTHRCRFHLAASDEDSSDGNCEDGGRDGDEDIDDDDEDDGMCGDDDGDIDNESADVDDDGMCGDDDGDIDNESADVDDDVDDDGMCGDDDEDIDDDGDDGDEGSVDVDADDKDVSDDEMECDDIKGDCDKSVSDIVDCNKSVSDIVDCNKSVSDIVDCNKSVSDIVDCNKSVSDIVDCNKSVSDIVDCNKSVSNIVDCNKSVSDIVDCNKSVSNIVDCNKIVTDILDCNKSNNIIHNYASSLSSSKRIRKPNRKYL